MDIQERIAAGISHALRELYALEVAAQDVALQQTRPEFEGHLTLVVFPYLRASRQKPQDTAAQIGERLVADGVVAKYNAVNGFLNMVIGPEQWTAALQDIAKDESWGLTAPTDDAPLVMIEYSSPNTNKPLHLGHVRNNLLGCALANVMTAAGNRVVKTNIVNDRGIHICKSMLAWLKWGNGETPESSGKKGDHLIGDYYVEFSKHESEELMAEARQMLVKWEQGDPEVRALWQRMNEWVYAGFDQTYKALGVTFDKIYYESQTYLEGKEKVLEGLDKGIFYRREDGSVWADLRPEGLDEKLLLRQDGTSVYMTQDIGTAKLRYQDYPIDKMIYVVGNEQNYHFQVLSILLDKLGFAWGKDLVHFSYGMVELPNGKMKSREGTVVDADDLIAKMVEQAREMTSQRADEATAAQADEIARVVGLAALKYFILKVDARKNMLFDPEESIDFNGNTGPFILYTYARICSILRRAEEQPTLWQLPVCQLSDKEISLIQTLTDFPNVIRKAAADYNPSCIANYAYDLVKEYNQFYHDMSVLREPDADKRTVRIALSRAVGQVIKNAMGVLGIEVTERM